MPAQEQSLWRMLLRIRFSTLSTYPPESLGYALVDGHDEAVQDFRLACSFSAGRRNGRAGVRDVPSSWKIP